jgi:hypothetical protein
MRAILRYGYRPSLRGLLICFSQLVVVSLLPGRLIYPLFRVFRGIKGEIKSVGYSLGFVGWEERG